MTTTPKVPAEANDDSARALRAEVALRNRERELSQLVDMVPSHLWRLTPDGEPIFFNKRMVDFLGLDVMDADKPGVNRLDAIITTVIHPDDATAFKDALNLCLATGQAFAMRHRLRRADDVYRWMSSRAEPMRDEAGRIVQWYGLCHDIDDHMRLEAALGDRERELSHLVNLVPSLLWRLAPNGEPIFFNKRTVDFIGLNAEDLDKPDMSRLAATQAALVHPDDAASLRDTLNCSLVTGERFDMRFRLRRADGVYHWMSSRAEPMRDEEGRIVQWYGLTVDIDELVTVQEALRDRERELSQLVDMVPSHVWRLRPDGEPIFFNRRMVDFIGLDVDDCDKPGMSRLDAVIETIHPDDAGEFGDTLKRSVITGESFSMRYRLRRADGVYRWMSSRAEPRRDESGRILQWYGICHDIDDQVRLYSELEEREAKIRRLVDSDIIGIVIWDLDGQLIDANEAFLRMVQYDRKDLQTGLRWFDMTPPEWQDVHAREEAEELARTGKMQAREKEFFRKNGTRVPVLIGAACFEGQSRQGVAYILDLSEQKRAEAALRDHERELAQLVDMLPVYIRRLTPEGEPIFFNKRLTDFIGVDLVEIGTPCGSRLVPAIEGFVHPDEADKVVAALRRAVATGEAYVMTYRMRGADGQYRWIETRAEPLRNQDGTIAQWYSVSIDIEDEVRAQQAEEALRETSDKLVKATHAASLAELSASIAHEVNQPLAAIVANSHACHRWLSAAPPNIERAKITAERIIRDANSAADVVSRVRALFRQSPEPRSETMLHNIVLEARNLMAEEAQRRGIRMDVDVDETNLPLMTLDRAQIQQVLINLVRNGMDAMDATSEDRILGMRVRRMGDVIQTEVSDRGRGVEVPDKIFEPFFTTKEHGMGMGLSICRSIVESHGGRLWVEKNEPQGATFIFTLPVEAKTAP